MEIAPNVHQVEGVLPISNVYLVVGSEGLVLIDAGVAWTSRAPIRYIQRLGFEPSALKAVFITHGDPDHTGGLRAIVQETGATVVAHQAEVALVDGAEKRRSSSPDFLDRLMAPFVGLLMPAKPVAVSRPVSDGESLFGLEVIHTPGHSPGSACYWLREQKVLFAGDALTHWGGQLSLPMKAYTTDMALAVQSVKRIAQYDFEVCCFGHGPAITKDARAAIADFAARIESYSDKATA